MDFYFLNWVQLSYDFGKVVPSSTTQGKVSYTIKSGWNVRNILNPKCIKIQFSQLQGGMEGKKHCPKAFHDTKNKRVNLRQHVERI